MITIRKNHEPVSLTNFKSKGGKRFDDLDAQTKTDIRNSLLTEQGYICAYCMKRIGRDRNEDGLSNDVKIEHVIPRSETSKSPQTEMQELNYHNLVAVCKGSTNGTLHCDSSKGNSLINLDPCNEAVEASIKYALKDGTISSSNELWNDDINNINKLNLNHPTLKTNRSAAVKGLQQALDKTKKWNRSGLERYLERLDDKAVKPEYIGILKYYINKKLSQK